MRGLRGLASVRRAGWRVVRLTVAVFVFAVVVGSVGWSGAEASDFHGSITAGGSSVTVSLPTSGDKGYLTFSGTLGEHLGLGITSNTFSGFTLSLNNSSGGVATWVSPPGELNLPKLPSTDTYTFVIDPAGGTGSVTFTLSDDVTDTITAGGASTTASISRVGQNERVTFAGTAGEKLGIAFTGTTISQGNVTLMRGPNDTAVSIPFTIFGSGNDTSQNWPSAWGGLPADDTYTILLDPETFTGSVTLTLSDDLTGSIAIGGASTTATIARQGQNERVTFSGTANETLGIGLTGATTSGTVTLFDSSGNSVGEPQTLFQSNNDNSANWGLPSNDTYTMFVEPGTGTGSVTLTLSDDVTASLAIGGPPLPVSISRRGQNARISFRSAVGQNLGLLVTGSTVSPWVFVTVTNPDGHTNSVDQSAVFTSAGFGVLVGGMSSGRSSIFLDPGSPGAGTGSLTLQLFPLGDAPTDGASFTACGTTPTFRAEPVAGSNQQYQFQVATDSGFSSVVSDSGLLPSTNTFTPQPGALSNGGTYYWRWKTATGSWSSGRSFSLNQSHLGDDGSPMWSNGPLAVNEVNGNLLVSLPGPGYPSEVGSLAAALAYNSLDSTDRGLGAGWSLNVGASTADAPAQLLDHNLLPGNARVDAVEAIAADGSSTCFTQVGQTNTYTAAPGDGSQLAKNIDGTWTYIGGDTLATYGVADGETGLADLTTVEVDSASLGKGKLTYSFSADDPTKVTSVSDDTGRSLSFSWNTLDPSGCPDAVVCITGPDGVTWKLVGDGTGGTSGKLVRINDGTRDLAAVGYDGSGRVNALQNANDLDPTHASPGYNGSHMLAVSYDGSGRVASVSNGPITGQLPTATSTWTFDHHPGNVSTTATRALHAGTPLGTVRTAAGYTTVTPPNQQGRPSPKSVKSFYDGHGNLLERDDLLGRVTEAGYTSHDQLLWTEDADGNPTDYTYDPVNEVPLTATAPAPSGTTTYRYDETKIGTTGSAGPALQGLQGAYYDNLNLAGRPKLLETDPDVDVNWGTGGPSGLGVTDQFSVRWTGTITLPSNGAYTFSVRSDDGARLTVGGLVAVDDWKDQAVTTTSSQQLSFTAGTYKLRLEYYEQSGPAEVHLNWSCAACTPAISDQVIPSTALQPAWENQTSTVSPLGRIAYSHFAQPSTGNPDYSLVQAPVNGTTSPLITSYDYDNYGRIADTVMPNGNSGRTIDTNGNLQGSPNTSYETTSSYYSPTDTASPPAACGGGSAVNQAGQLETNGIPPL